MKQSKRIQFVLAFFMLACLGFVAWKCSTEKIGPKDPSPIAIAQIVAELANAKTQPEAEAAIEHLLDKTGIGRAIKGSRYGDYLLPEGFIAELAQDQLRYSNDPDYALTWGEAFEHEALTLDEDGQARFNFSEVAARFREQATVALDNPEDPNYALLLALAAEGGSIPGAISVDENTILSAVQDFLFSVWVDHEFLAEAESFNVILGAKSKLKINLLTVECPSGKAKKVETITLEFEKRNKQLKSCLKAAQKQYNQALKACRKTFKEEKKIIGQAAACENLKDCYEAAATALLDAIDTCFDQFHDQGGGD
jgi:hypothetical protein